MKKKKQYSFGSVVERTSHNPYPCRDMNLDRATNMPCENTKEVQWLVAEIEVCQWQRLHM